jgi:hypothetical protein
MRTAEPGRISDTLHGKQNTDLNGIFKQVALSDNGQPTATRHADHTSRSHTELEADAITEVLPTLVKSRPKNNSGSTQIFQKSSQETVASTTPVLRHTAEKKVPFLQKRGETSGSSREINGEFTRLFQHKDEPQTVNEDPRPVSQKTAAATEPGGVFTQILRSLSSERDAEMQSHAVAPPVLNVKRQAQEPGEFTEIMSRSLLRDANNRPHEERTPELATPPAPAPASKAEAPNPQALRSHASMPMRHADEPVSAPQAKTTGTLHKYVPLLLIMNLLTMVLVLILVGVALLRR